MVEQNHTNTVESRSIKKEVENYAGIKKVEFTEYEDIINVIVHGPVFKPSNFKDSLNNHGWEITHIDFEENKIEYAKLD